MNISQPWNKSLGYLMQNKAKFKKNWDKAKVRATPKEAPNTIHNSHTEEDSKISNQEGSMNKSLEKLGLTFLISMGKKM